MKIPYRLYVADYEFHMDFPTMESALAVHNTVRQLHPHAFMHMLPLCKGRK